jgi:lauroyl/myristoyl acyltransferase
VIRLVEFAVLRGLLAGAQAVPAGACSGLARAAARAAYHLDGRHRRRAESHLRLAFAGARAESEIRRISRRCFEELAGNAAAFVRLLRGDRPTIAFRGEEIIRSAHAAGKGVVVVSAHLGPFTLLGCLSRQLGIPATVVLKRQKNARLLSWFAGAVRSRFGVEILPKPEAPARAPGVLRQGRALVLFADQHPISGGIPATFFARPVEAASGPAVLAKRYGAPLVVLTIARGEAGVPLARFDGPVPLSGSLGEVTQRWLDLLEARIREHPEQWMWMHRRWRGMTK